MPVRKKPVSSLTQKIDAAVIAKLAKNEKHDRLSLARRVTGALLLALWAGFLAGEYFQLVAHPGDFSLEHMLTKWSPLFVGLLLLAPDAFERLAAFMGTLKGLRITKKDG